MEKMTMMLVDDEERYLQTTAKLIEKKGYQILTAKSGKEALETLKSQKVHVMVLDMKMPGMDGNETLKAVKELYPLMKIIILTGHAGMDSAMDGIKSGAFDFLIKPVDLDQILKKALDAFQTHQRIEQ